MNLKLIRHYLGFVDAAGRRWPTLGRVPVGEYELSTLEDPWNNNEPFNSCVPDGVYSLVPHSTDKHPDTWALVNPDLNIYHYPSPDKKPADRFACLIHSGNWEDDVEGCILVGMTQTIMPDRVHHRQELAVSSSRMAMDILRQALGEGVHTLEITTAKADMV